MGFLGKGCLKIRQTGREHRGFSKAFGIPLKIFSLQRGRNMI